MLHCAHTYASEYDNNPLTFPQAAKEQVAAAAVEFPAGLSVSFSIQMMDLWWARGVTGGSP